MAFVSKKSGTSTRYYAYMSNGDAGRFSVPLGSNLRAARKAYSDLESRWRRGQYSPLIEVSWERAVDDWRQHGVVGLRENTVTAYSGVLERTWAPRFKGRRVSSIRVPEVQAVVADLVAQGRAPRGVRLAVASLSAVLAVAERNGHAHGNAARQVSLPAVPRSNTAFLTVEQLGTLIAGAATLPPMEKAIVVTAATTGLRRAELAGICTDAILDAYTDDARLVVRRSAHNRTLTDNLKNDASYGEVPLTKTAADALRDWLVARPAVQGVQGDILFTVDGRPLRDGHYNAILRRALRRANMPEDAVSYRGLRHSVASALANQGVPLATLQGILRHRAGSAVTMETYVHASEEEARLAIDVLSANIALHQFAAENLPF